MERGALWKAILVSAEANNGGERVEKKTEKEARNVDDRWKVWRLAWMLVVVLHFSGILGAAIGRYPF